MSTVKVARQAYRRARQNDLVSFSENIITRMTGSATYATLQPQVQALSDAVTRYAETLAAARNRGMAEVLAKNLAKAALVAQLDVVASALDIVVAGNPQLIVDAGFPVPQSPGQRYTGKLPAPAILRAFSTGKKGEVRVLLDDFAPEAVLTHAIEYSEDRGNTWKNGEYHSRRKFVVNGLPHAADLWLHVKSVGHGNNRSEWSEPVAVAVL